MGKPFKIFTCALLILHSTTLSFATTSSCRQIVILLDASSSFQFRDQALEHVRRQTPRIGPNDRFLFIEIGDPPFLPSKNVRLQAKMPSVAPDILKPTRSIHRWRRNQRTLSLTWKRVQSNLESIGRFLKHPLAVQHRGTDLYGALEYASQRLKSARGKKILIIYSDLLHDRGKSTSDPPRAAFPGFDQTEVTLLFVPWSEGSWDELRKKWQAYFELCGAGSFSIYDPAQSKLVVPMPPSPIPKRLVSPFSTP